MRWRRAKVGRRLPTLSLRMKKRVSDETRKRHMSVSWIYGASRSQGGGEVENFELTAMHSNGGHWFHDVAGVESNPVK